MTPVEVALRQHAAERGQRCEPPRADRRLTGNGVWCVQDNAAHLPKGDAEPHDEEPGLRPQHHSGAHVRRHALVHPELQATAPFLCGGGPTRELPGRPADGVARPCLLQANDAEASLVKRLCQLEPPHRHPELAKARGTVAAAAQARTAPGMQRHDVRRDQHDCHGLPAVLKLLPNEVCGVRQLQGVGPEHEWV